VNNKIYRILIFFGLLIMSDFIIGVTLKVLYNRTNDYSVSKLRYTLDSLNHNILIFGSSRAQHHYNSKIISKETGKTTFNCGFNGQGTEFSYMQMTEIFKRFKPQLVVLDISPNILTDPESDNKLKFISPYFRRDEVIYEGLTKNRLQEKVKFLSGIYPYNSTIFSVIRGCIKEKPDSLEGYLPIFGAIDTTRIKYRTDKLFDGKKIDEKDFIHLEMSLKLCCEKTIPVLVVIGPVYYTSPDFKFMIQQIEEFCQKYDSVGFINLSEDSDFSGNEKLFKDNVHLNTEGANYFSIEIAHSISGIIN